MKKILGLSLCMFLIGGCKSVEVATAVDDYQYTLPSSDPSDGTQGESSDVPYMAPRMLVYRDIGGSSLALLESDGQETELPIEPRIVENYRYQTADKPYVAYLSQVIDTEALELFTTIPQRLAPYDVSGLTELEQAQANESFEEPYPEDFFETGYIMNSDITFDGRFVIASFVPMDLSEIAVFRDYDSYLGAVMVYDLREEEGYFVRYPGKNKLYAARWSLADEVNQAFISVVVSEEKLSAGTGIDGRDEIIVSYDLEDRVVCNYRLDLESGELEEIEFAPGVKEQGKLNFNYFMDQMSCSDDGRYLVLAQDETKYTESFHVYDFKNNTAINVPVSEELSSDYFSVASGGQIFSATQAVTPYAGFPLAFSMQGEELGPLAKPGDELGSSFYAHEVVYSRDDGVAFFIDDHYRNGSWDDAQLIFQDIESIFKVDLLEAFGL